MVHRHIIQGDNLEQKGSDAPQPPRALTHPRDAGPEQRHGPEPVARGGEQTTPEPPDREQESREAQQGAAEPQARA